MTSSASTPFAACADDLDAAELAEQEAQLVPRQLLVVDDDRRDAVVVGRHGAGLLAAPPASSGISSARTVPSPGERCRAASW